MSEPTPTASNTVSANLPIGGGAAIVAPVAAFAGGIPPNALIVLPVKKPTDEMLSKLKEGALVVTPEEMWRLLGFNGPAVQVQDNEGRPMMIGVDDLLAGLEKHWKEGPTDLNRGRLYAQELLKHNRAAQAEKVLSKVVAGGGTGEDWLGLGVAQYEAEAYDRAEGTLKGAQNLLPGNPFPALRLSQVYRKKEQPENERTMIEKAISIDPACVEAWATLYTSVKRQSSEDEAVRAVETLAEAAGNLKSAAPFVALQSFYAEEPTTRDRAFGFAKKAVERNPDDAMGLIALSALHGHAGDLPAVIALLSQHEGKMLRDVRLAHNYFEALFQSRDIERITKLLNSLAGSPNREVKQFAQERMRAVAQMLQRQQQALQQGAARGAAPRA
jgi:tetratricopeptide (TPR) repeat protein